MTRDQLILEHYDLVRRVARRMAARYPSSVEVDDLLSIGTLGLIDAAERYDGALAPSFAGYARIRVQGAIVDALRRGDWVPRSVRNRARSLQHTRDQLAARLGRAPSGEEVAAELGVEVARARKLDRDAQLLVLVSMDEKRADSDHTVGDGLASPDADAETLAVDASLRARVLEAVAALPERDRHIVRRYYFDGISFKDIGEELGVTESRVSQLHSRIKARLQQVLAEDVLAAAA